MVFNVYRKHFISRLISYDQLVICTGFVVFVLPPLPLFQQLGQGLNRPGVRIGLLYWPFYVRATALRHAGFRRSSRVGQVGMPKIAQLRIGHYTGQVPRPHPEPVKRTPSHGFVHALIWKHPFFACCAAQVALPDSLCGSSGCIAACKIPLSTGRMYSTRKDGGTNLTRFTKHSKMRRWSNKY